MRKYSATALMCFKEKGYFGLMEMVGQYVVRLATLLALLAVWRALFQQGVEYEGFELSQMLAYTVLGSALAPLLNVRTPASGWLHDGTILSVYLRPASIFGQIAAHTVGSWLMPLALYGVPVIVVASLSGVDLAPRTLWVIPSIILTVAEGFAVDYLFACLLMRMKNLEWTVFSIREAVSSLLSGALIPFAALPFGIGKALSLTPFGSLAGAPLALYVGLDSAAKLIPLQLLWTAILWPLAYYLFTKSSERLVSYGG